MIKSMMNMLKDESGATAIEYALVVALVSLVLAGAVAGMEGGVDSLVEDINSELDVVTED